MSKVVINKWGQWASKSRTILKPVWIKRTQQAMSWGGPDLLLSILGGKFEGVRDLKEEFNSWLNLR